MGHGCCQAEAAGFPIFSDLYALVQEKTKTEKENQVYTDLSMLLYDIAEGAGQFYLERTYYRFRQFPVYGYGHPCLAGDWR